MDMSKAAVQLGMEPETAGKPDGLAGKARTEENTHTDCQRVLRGPWGQNDPGPEGTQATSDDSLDHFMHRDGRVFAGMHLIVDLWNASHLDDIAFIDRTLRRAVAAADATLLHIHLHHFTPNGGVSGVAVLAESHISIHTWPERSYAALDVFMCGDAKPERAVEVLEQSFQPGQTRVSTHHRGEIKTDTDARM